jgi:hypothetical protein
MTWALANPDDVAGKRIIRRERQHMMALVKLTPHGWLARIRSVPYPQRADVARIIWWDYFCDIPQADPRGHILDRYLDDPPSDKMPVRLGLLACGYSPWQVFTRI